MIPGLNLARWLPTDFDPLRRAIVERAMMDDGILEMPPGSNRSGVIDAYCTACGSPLGSYWCAAAVWTWLKDVGAAVPEKLGGSCDAWLNWGEGLLLRRPAGQLPVEGDVVLYGSGRDAHHAGVVIRVYHDAVRTLILSKEGNTSIGGTTVTRNGLAVVTKAVDEKAVLCYLSVKAAP